MHASAPISLILVDIHFFKLLTIAIRRKLTAFVRLHRRYAARPSGRAISLRAPVVGFVLELLETRPEGAVAVANSTMEHAQNLVIPHTRSGVSSTVTLSLIGHTNPESDNCARSHNWVRRSRVL